MTERKGRLLRVTLVKSPIGYNSRQRATVQSLGLRRMGRSVLIGDAPQVRGMIDTLLDKCAGRDLYLGASLGPDWDSVKEWASRGMRWFGVGDDIDYVVGGARQTMAEFRAAMGELGRE